MPEIFDYKYVKECFSKAGYILLESTYINSTSKMQYSCNNGHTHFIRWFDFRRGVRCPYCYGNARLTTAFVSKELALCGYRLLNKYKNCYTKLECLCDKGHFHDTTWNDWRSGCRCATCANITRAVNQSGSSHPQWRGCVSFEPYCEIWYDKDYKDSIKERDGYKCQNPYCFRNNGNASILSVHHINYVKKDCHPHNLITLCKSCNGMANKDRDWHEEWYKIIMCKKYNIIR